jgi:sulfate adenylyltransferase subunit 1
MKTAAQPPIEHARIVIVGHVDHGKSTLIGRLSYETGSLSPEKIEEIKKACESMGGRFEFAYVMDYLQEEREQSMTIDTSQYFFKTAKRSYVIIDTPGHKEFMKNMITGASQAQAAVLIIDVQRGVEEQTRRHAYMLSMLNIKSLVVVVNKMDAVSYAEQAYAAVKKSAGKFLSELGLTPAFYIPLSAKEGDNISRQSPKTPWYRGPPLLDAIDSLPLAIEESKQELRLPVQDVYLIKGKRIIVGRVEQGTLKAGDAVIILPSKTKATVRSIESFMEDKKSAEKGESIGIILAGDVTAERGNVICTGENQPTVTKKIKASIFWMSEQPMFTNEKITLKIATQEVTVTVTRIEKKLNSSTLEEITDSMDRLGETEAGVVCVNAEEPLIVDSFNSIPELGRFVLMRENTIIAGGIIV